MASTSYMECLLRIDTAEGWEGSATKVLASFEDLSYDINPSAGFIYVKGKADPQLILKKLKKGGKHATIQRISYGFPRDDNNQRQVQDPFCLARHPYENYYQFNPPYSWFHNMPQNALPYGNHFLEQHQHQHQHQNALPYGNQFLEHENRGHINDGRSCSGRSYDSHCPVRPRHNHSPVSSQNGNIHVQNSSPPFVQSGASDQANNPPTPQQSSGISIKKIIDKFRLCVPRN